MYYYFFHFDLLLSLYTCRISIYGQKIHLFQKASEVKMWNYPVCLCIFHTYIHLFTLLFLLLLLLQKSLRVGTVYHIDNSQSNYLFYTFKYYYSEVYDTE